MPGVYYSHYRKPLPYDTELELLAASYRSKQLIVLAADVLLESISLSGRHPDEIADALVRGRILPEACRDRYDQVFLTQFYNVVELTRNLLVSDAPFVASTAGELAAHAILGQARAIIADGGSGWEVQAMAVDPSLPRQLETNPSHLGEELDLIEDAVIEDGEVLGLLEVSEGAPGLGDPLPGDSLLRFEHWLVPFGNPPRPCITYDGRAWPGEA